MKRYINRFTKWLRKRETIEEILCTIGGAIALIASIHIFIILKQDIHWIIALVPSVVLFLVSTLVIPIFVILMLYGFEMLWRLIRKQLKR